MFVCACGCGCVCVFGHVFAFVCVFVYVCACVHVCVHAWYVCMCVCMCVCGCVGVAMHGHSLPQPLAWQPFFCSGVMLNIYGPSVVNNQAAWQGGQQRFLQTLWMLSQHD